MKVRPIVWLIAAAVVAVDQLSKQWSLSNLTPGEAKPLLGSVLSLELVFNDGAAFSLGAGYTWVLTLIALVVTIGIAVYAKRARSNAAAILFGVGLGGALGNLIDRVFRAPSFGQGHVVDMINYNGWFVGNVADIAIVGAAIVFVLLAVMGKRLLEPVDVLEGEADDAEDHGAEDHGADSADRG